MDYGPPRLSELLRALPAGLVVIGFVIVVLVLAGGHDVNGDVLAGSSPPSCSLRRSWLCCGPRMSWP